MPFNVTMPDGTVIAGVPEGTTQTELSAKYQGYQQVQPKEETPSTSFGSNRGVGQQGVSQGAALNAAESGVTAVPAAVANAAKTAYTLSGGTGQETGPTPGMASNRGVNYPQQGDYTLGQEFTNVNKAREGMMEGNPAAKGLDIAGQAAIPVLGSEGAVAKGMSYLPKWMGGGVQGLAARSAIRSGIGAGQGATVEAEQPHDNQTRGQIGTEMGQAAKTGAAVNAGVGASGDLLGGIGKWFKENFSSSEKNAQARATKELSDITSDQQLAAGKQYTATPQNQRQSNLSTAEATATPNAKGQPIVSQGLGAEQRNIQSGENLPNKGFPQTANTGEAQVSPDRVFKEQNQQNKDKLAAEIQQVQSPHAGILQGTPTAVEAGKTLTTGQKVAAEQSRLAYHAQYDSAKVGANDEKLVGPVHDESKQNFTDLSEGKTRDLSNAQLIHGTDSMPKDEVLSKVDDAFAGRQEIPVGDQIDMKNELRAHAEDLHDYAYKSLNPGSAEFKATLARAQVAKQMADNVVDNLKRTTDVTTKAGESVSEAVQKAEDMKIAHEKNFNENPDTFKGLADRTNAPAQNMQTGTVSGGQVYQPYGASPSSTGKALQTARAGKEAAPATVANQLVDSSNPEEFDSQIKSFKATPGGGKLISDKILADIKTEGAGDPVKTEKAFNKYYGPQQQESFAREFPNEHERLMKANGDTIVNSIKDQVVSKDTKTGLSTVNTEKFGNLLDEHEDVLRQTLGNAGFNRLKEIHAANSVLDQIGQLPARTTPLATHKEATAAIKGLTQKAFKLSYTAINAITMGLGDSAEEAVRLAKAQMLNDPDKAIPAIEAFRNGEKDPQGVVSAIMSLAGKSAASGAAAVPAHNDYNLKKEQQQEPLKVTVHPENKGPEVNLPQSKNEVPSDNEQSFLSQFSPVSNANAAELPNEGPSDSKKNGEYKIAQASETTGMPEAYIKALENSESGNIKNPDRAKNPNSSAYGRGQFTEKTWNDLADEYDLPKVTAQNRYTKDDPRANTKYSRLAAGYYGSDNADNLRPWIQSKFSRETTIADVYGAHLMGLGGVKKFLAADPESSAADIVPAAAKNNKSLFYKDGKPLSVRQVYMNIEDRLGPDAQPQTEEPDAGGMEFMK